MWQLDQSFSIKMFENAGVRNHRSGNVACVLCGVGFSASSDLVFVILQPSHVNHPHIVCDIVSGELIDANVLQNLVLNDVTVV